MFDLIKSLFTAGIGYLFNNQQRQDAFSDSLALQKQNQEFTSAEAEKTRQWQEDFWKENQSPQAQFANYRDLGASESASLMSALGVSPSVPGAAAASSSPAGGLGAGVNTMADLMNAISGGFNNFMQGQKAKNESEWVGPVNEANIKATLGQLELNWKKFGLDKDIYTNISVLLANMALDKSRQEISESEARIKEIDEKILQIEQQIKESKQNVEESQARVDLYGQQALTEIEKQANFAADTELKGSEKELTDSKKVGQDIENSLQQISLEASQAVGFDVRLSGDRQVLHGIKVVAQGVQTSWKDFSQGVVKTYDGLLRGIDYQSFSKRVFHSVHKYMSNPFFPVYDVTGYSSSDFKVNQSYKEWLRKRAKKWKEAEDWINHNTRYGM